MLLFRDNHVIDVDTREDSVQDFIIVKRIPELMKEYKHDYIQDCVGTIKAHYPNDHTERMYYYCTRTQSEFRGELSRDGIIGASATKGELISNAWKYNFRVYIKTADRWIELTKEGPRELLENERMYMTQEEYAEVARKSEEFEMAYEEHQEQLMEERLGRLDKMSDQEFKEEQMMSAANDVDMGYNAAVKYATQPGLTDEEYEKRELSLSGRYDLNGNER